MNMNKVKSFINENRGKILATVGTVATLGPISAFAEETPSISTTISSSMQTIVTDTIATMAAVAPIGITIFGAAFCWKKGKKILTTIAN